MTTQTLTITEFLLARIAEDEARVEGFWSGDPGATPDFYWGIDRIRAECGAKRRIVEWHKSWPVLVERRPTLEQADPTDINAMTFRMSQQMAWITEQEYRTRFGDEPPTGPILRFLASVYADHPDYRAEWSV